MNDFFSGVHLHLLVNHAPILGAFFALVLLLVSLVAAPDVLRRTAFVVLVATGIAAALANFSGEPAEEAVEGLPGVLESIIHEHEELGEASFIGAALLGVLALGALLRWRRVPVPRNAALVLLLGSAVVSVLMAYTGLLGGRIRHTEVRPGATPADARTVEPEEHEQGE
ncbi:MAG TPA: hypothetical protein VFO83_00375 [Aggregicoccus sp.]|nr:hypothetical protein [Aggregicoccus sp.]